MLGVLWRWELQPPVIENILRYHSGTLPPPFNYGWDATVMRAEPTVVENI